MADFATPNPSPKGGRRGIARANAGLTGPSPPRCGGYVQRKGAGFIGAHSYKRRYMELHRDAEGLGPVLLVHRRYGGKVCAKTVLDGYDRISMPAGKKKGKHVYFEIAHKSRTARRFRVEDEAQRKKWMDGITLALKEHAAGMTPEQRRRIDAFLKSGNADAEDEPADDDDDDGAAAPGGDATPGSPLDDVGDLDEALDAPSPRARAQTGEDFEAAHRALLESRHRSRRVRRSFKHAAPAAADHETSDASDDDGDDDDGGDWCEWKTYVDDATGHTYFMNDKGESYWGAAVLHDADHGPWEARVDHATGATYYFNVDTEVSQWERPDDYVPPRTAAEEAEAPAAEEPEAPAAEEPETRGRSDTEHHHHTKHRPRALPGLAKADSRLALPAVRAPCAWEARHDPNHDATYYYNATTGESTWEKPADFCE